MKTKLQRKKNKRRKTKKYTGRGPPGAASRASAASASAASASAASASAASASIDASSLVKKLLIENVHNRFVETPRPEDIREYTIHPGNMDKILTYMRAKSVNKETVADPILKPVLSKGPERIINLQDFINKLNGMELSDDIRAILISQFIILNQVFGDGNHRAGLFVLRNHSSFGEERIQKIMKLTERMHAYGGDLRSRGFWRRENDIYVPDFSKMDEMLRQ
jgi:hypothetical protein